MDHKKTISKFISRDPVFCYRYSKDFQTIAYLRGNLTQAANKSAGGLRKTALAFLGENAELFGENSFEKLEVLIENKDRNGGADIVYQQYHGRSPVYSSSVNFHFNSKGILDTVRSSLNPTLASVPREPKITADEAAEKALRKLRPSELIEVKETLCYYFNGKTYLVWEVHLRGLEPSEKGIHPHWIVYVDAITGRIIDYYDTIMTATTSVGSGIGFYSGPQPLNTSDDTAVNGNYHLVDTSRSSAGPVIVTNDVYGTPLQPSEDPNNQWDNLTPALRKDNQGAEVDVHHYAGKVADYLKTTFNRNGWNGTSGDFISYVHEGNELENCFWDIGGAAFFGDGKGHQWSRCNYMCCKDMVAHEFGHGVVQSACGLSYNHTESAALHEAFADYIAALVNGDWLIGEDSYRPHPLVAVPAAAFRNMKDPTNNGLWVAGNPLGSASLGHLPNHCSPLRTPGYPEIMGGDPHVNCGPIDQFFYLLTDGGTPWGSNITLAGIGQSAAEQLFYNTITVKLVGNQNANFLDFRQAMIDSCIDMFPGEVFKLNQVKKAFYAVGIGPDMFIRDFLWDNGEEPYSSVFFESPDILNFYENPLPPTVDLQDLNFNTSMPLEIGQTNYVYVRLQNRGFADSNPIVYLYLMPASLFGPFSSWVYVGTIDPGVGYPWYSPGMIYAQGLAIPKTSLPAAGHYCMIALIQDAYDPAPDPMQIATISDYIDYIRDTNNVAYRNMDVVDALPNVFKWHEYTVGHMGTVAISYDISIDLTQFFPEAEFYIRGPRKAFDGANVRGLKLVERDGDDNIYRALTGEEFFKQQKFTPRRKDAAEPIFYGFEDVRINEAFKIQVGCKMPSEDVFKKLGEKRLQEGFQFVMSQFYEGQVLGRAGLRFKQKSEEKSVPKNKTKPQKRAR